MCGSDCSQAATAFLECLGAEGRSCTYASGGLPAIVRHGALDGEEMRALAALTATSARRQDVSSPRTFGAADGTTGHNVTWLTPLIYKHSELLQKLRALVSAAAAEGGWQLDEAETLNLR